MVHDAGGELPTTAAKTLESLAMPPGAPPSFLLLTRFPPKLITMNLGACRVNSSTLLALIFLALFIGHTTASLGDHLPDFKECVQVSFPQVKETLAHS